ncbi:MAG: hypothetical protein GWN35_03055 [Actinobacteria bacterium]|nr:hypothetical protein [Actinomycetota bacterium]
MGCVPEAPPPRPTMGEGDGPERFYVLRDVRVEQGADWREIGWDRDGICTEAPDFESECVPPEPVDGIEEDGARGIDNVFGHEVVVSATLFGDELEAPFRAHQEMGLGVTLVRVLGWNGMDEDGQVEVIVAPGAFGTPPDAAGGVPPLPADGSLPPPPAWDGMDYFWADENAFLDGNEDRPLIRDDAAYVTQGLLVMRPPDRSSLFLTAEDKSLEIRLADAVLTAEIADDGLSNVILAGRWRGPDFLEVLPTLGFCNDTPDTTAYDRLVRLVEIKADVRAVPGSGGPEALCDALSTGIGFTGVPAQWAGLATPPPRVSGCE